MDLRDRALTRISPGWIVALVAMILCGAASAGETERASGEVLVVDRLDWEHPGLDLYMWSLQMRGSQTAVRFCLRLRPALPSASVAIGYPRYRTPSHRWSDAVTEGIAGRSRMLHASRAEGVERVFFTVLVPADATAVRVEVGPGEVQVDLASRLPALRAAAGASAGAGQQPTATQLPDRPVRLVSRVRWETEKPFGDGALDAGERVDLLVDVTNHGSRATEGPKVGLASDDPSAVKLPEETTIRRIDPGQTRTVRLVFWADRELSDGNLGLTVQVREPHGHDAPPIRIEVPTRTALSPDLVVLEDFAIVGSPLPVPRDMVVTVRLRVRNVGQGVAEAALARIQPSEGIFRAHESPAQFELGDLRPGDVAEIEYRCYANRRAPTMDLELSLSDARTGRGNTIVTVPLEDSSAAAHVVRVRADRRVHTPIPPAPAPMTSQIDRETIRSSSSRPTALAVVLGVEKYQSAPPATFSSDDAATAARYFENVLGIPEHRIQNLTDEKVTLGQLRRIFGEDGWLSRRVEPDTEIFVFFAGHGIGQADDISTYLMPTDADVHYVEQTGYSVVEMLQGLVDLDARRVSVFLDSCFSGLSRQGETLLAGARPLVLAPGPVRVPGVSLFSAARDTQTANALPQQGHGLFTYCLFRGLGGDADLDGDGRITSGELKSYLESEVPRIAELADREQAPSVYLADENEVLVDLR